MRRRALLALLGMAAVPGCSGFLAERGDETTVPATAGRTTRPDEEPETTEHTRTTDEATETTEESTETTQNEDDFQWPNGASVVDLRTGPRTLALAPRQYHSGDEARVNVEFSATATPNHPATVRAKLTNTADYANTFRLDETPPFGDVAVARIRDRRDLTYQSNWYLFPTANHDLVEKNPFHERGPEGYWRLDQNPSQELPRTVRLKPGEVIEGEYVLLGHADGEGRPTGRYEFRGHDDNSLRITAWETESPGPEDDSRFEGASLPRLPGESGTRWYHDAGPGTAVYLEPSTERGRLPERIDFTLYNYAREPITGNPYDWTLYKLVGGEWFHLAPWAIPLPMGSVPSGGTEEWTLYAFGGEGVRVESGQSVGFLGGGRYAFEVGMSGGDHSNAALFELVGLPVSVEPMAETTASRSGATVTVDVPDPDYEQEPGTLTLTRAESADERLVAEQVMRRRFRALRNGLPFFEPGVETVVVKTTENAAQDITGYDATSRSFRFDGQAYEASRETDEE